MSDELLMDLADCGSPEKLIATILQHHPDWQPPVPLEAFARKVGIVEFKDLTVEGFVGALMTDDAKAQGVILVKAGQREARRRFTVAHELGHFLIPTHRGSKHCTAQDLREGRRETEHQRQEAEANRFAAGFLMPKPWFERDMDGLGEAEVSHLQDLARRYETSLEATANRYVELSEDACAIVFSKDAVVRYARAGRRFPKLAVGKGDGLPPGCASLLAPQVPLRTPTDWSEVDGTVWVRAEWGEWAPMILEQSMRQRGGYQVTLLFTERHDADHDEEERDLERSWQVGFRR
ncbi:Zn-dependent peptidase ImmA, M78 family [Tistlia consotensis]|uniref:Zn-dependent peptidase ImmA, M78 family n=1 Tax=Tistlia consotensis USBA 355 TaxID=560819 RepID=A0A1Y6CFT0_9PROT|nr:ImmA/IrrE family metallo-endopeptidase [Tistlia consotensis]SMF53359.1 Zn-dependent peptidase ImmA, M78 family [Tistlia consotensis USBA 355]SNR85429.1 Zn-dependent peptidase ImmA, M78 family [Tistlia consotensis]